MAQCLVALHIIQGVSPQPIGITYPFSLKAIITIHGYRPHPVLVAFNIILANEREHPLKINPSLNPDTEFLVFP